MLTIALTGGIGCGKTTVCELFAQHNIPIIDTDLIARELVARGSPYLDQIVEHFGKGILGLDGNLNRKALASITFNDTEQKRILESILHPAIRSEVKLKLSKLDTHYVIIAIPLLIETGQQSEYDRVLVVDCSEQQQFERTLKRDKRTVEEIKSIMRSQVSRDIRIKLADDIVNNTSSLDKLEFEVAELHKKYLKMAESN